MIDAMSELCAEQGYEATKIADVVRRAHVARKTLYDNFSGKEELFLTAFDTALADAEAEVAEACDADRLGPLGGAHRSRHPRPARVRRRPSGRRPAGAGRGARRPRRRAAARYDAAIDGFISRLREAAPPGPGRPATLEEALVGGTAWIVQRQVRRGDAEDAVDLVGELTEFVISPYRSVGKR